MGFFENKPISIKQASQLTNYHPDYISSLIRTGKLKGVKIGRNWYTTKAAIKRFNKGTKVKSVHPFKLLFITSAFVCVAVVVGFWMASNFYTSEKITVSSETKTVSDPLNKKDNGNFRWAGKSSNYQLYEPVSQ